ncbi:hypothetical protein [Schlesneria sp.]|uniref:hypothetical protein n=1 Tax=Schlesneria sp. TaxID=2762018 RepID=UPI002F23B92B
MQPKHYIRALLLYCGFVFNYACQPAIAEEWRFLPGDAFFESALTQELADMMTVHEDGDTLSLRYHTHARVALEAGCAVLEIKRIGLKRRKLLACLYKMLRKQQAPIFEITTNERGELRRELNGMALLVYNKTFDYQRYAIGLRYNEDWAEEGAMFSTLPEFVNYYISEDLTPSCVIEDWRNSRHVPPLKVTFPPLLDKNLREAQFSPLTVDASEVIFVVVTYPMIEELRKNVTPWKCYFVNQHTIVGGGPTEEGWIEEEVNVDVDTIVEKDE